MEFPSKGYQNQLGKIGLEDIILIQEKQGVMRILRLHQQFRYNHILRKVMFAKTEFNPTPDRLSFPEEEEKIQAYWREKDCFKKQLELTKDFPPYTFYDGPPFATGHPHYGHICAGTIKDVVCRYASQTGHYVSRRFGWDCHGLPVEYEIDKTLGITDKRQVAEMGIAKYNAECRTIVMRYSSEWEKVIERFGRWIDFKNDYKTLDTNFMESVWYVFKTLFDKGLVYRGRKIMPYSNAVHTVLSNFEVQLNYKDVDDPSLWVSFPTVKNPDVKFLVWTTTPWTLPSNLALAVNPNFDYLKVRDLKRNEIYILAECRLPAFYKPKKKKKEGEEKEYEILEKIKGSDLKGEEYVPMFDFFQERHKDGCFRVQCADFVTADAGTGIVHCAPGFGEEDYKMCVREGIIDPDNPPVPLDDSGKFTNEVPTYAGVYVKDADKIIIKDLKERGRVVQHETEKHSYPFCWRSDTPLIYKAVSTWFIKVTSMKEDLLKNNLKAYWVPKSIQEKRFHNWLDDSQDWCFSRNRYWGNPIPLWVSDDGEQIVCVGSVEELQKLTGYRAHDLHRQNIDHLTIESKKGKGKLRRIEEVFDCWFESGSMPFAQVHYPFSTTEEQFQKIFPADFIGEGIDQTRGWFYTLNVIATGMKNSNPYKNLIVNGLVLNHEGKKMSKRLKNYPDPLEVVHKFGADAVRMYLINSPLVRADTLNFNEDGVQDVVKNVFLPWYNAYRFLIQNIAKLEGKTNSPFVYTEDMQSLEARFNVTDRWIESSLQNLITQVRKEMDEYKLYNVVPPLVKFLENLTNWYVRMNRNRIKGEVDDENMSTSINVLFDVLLKLNILMSPHVPFITDSMYQNMKKCINEKSQLSQDSIHHLSIPSVNEDLKSKQVEEAMNAVISMIETGRKLRDQKKISLKQPIMSLTIVVDDEELMSELKPFLGYIEEELNVATIHFEPQVSKYVISTCMPNLPVLGPKFKGDKSFGDVKKAISALTNDQIKVAVQKGELEVAGHTLQTSDALVIQQKHVPNSVQEHEIIGGEKVIILLDTRQDEKLKIKGFAREIINRVQKLKKKTGLSTEDDVFVFYHFPAESTNLNTAIETELEAIKNAVKKPLFHAKHKTNKANLGTDNGEINGENYEIFITRPHLMLDEENIKKDFENVKFPVLAMSVATQPYSNLKGLKEVKIKLDGVEITLVEGVHFHQH